MKLKRIKKNKEDTRDIFLLVPSTGKDDVKEYIANNAAFQIIIERDEAAEIIRSKKLGHVIALYNAGWNMIDISYDAQIPVMEVAKIIACKQLYPELVDTGMSFIKKQED